MSASPSTLPPRVLAVASHVVSGYVGNKIAVLVLQTLGCDVAALNTVQFSNHTGYRQWTGTRASAGDIADLYAGLRRSGLDDFDMMLSGYVPGAAAVAAVGDMARDLGRRARARARRFFWVLDPVMGDNGRLYVASDVVPAYKDLAPSADLILPNQFEAELLSGVAIADMASLSRAIQALHDQYGVPHVVITSVRLDAPDHARDHLCVVGSTMDSAGRARLFKIVFPAIDCYFCGTGDMFGALITMRMREAVDAVPGLAAAPSWRSPDAVAAPALPLARATEKVLASMHEVLSRTRDAMPAVVARARAAVDRRADDDGDDDGAREACVKTRAAELQLVGNLDCLRNPATVFEAQPV